MTLEPAPLPLHWFLRATKSSSSRSALATVGSNDSGGTQGFYINNNGYGDICAAAGAMTSSTLPAFSGPAGGYAGNYLYAPTTKGSDNNCLESVTNYFNTGNGMNYHFTIADWCQLDGLGNPRYTSTLMDSTFFNNYVRTFTNGNGYPEYQEETYEDAGGIWHQLLYNENTGVYDDVYDTSGIPPSNINGYGWSVFETHFSSGMTCPSFSSPISVSGVREWNGSSWPELNGSNTTQLTSGGDCFNSSSPPYYSISWNSDWGWWVSDI